MLTWCFFSDDSAPLLQGLRKDRNPGNRVDNSDKFLFVEINRTNRQKHTGTLCDFIMELEPLISVISKKNRIMFLMGNWNVYLIHHLAHQAMCEFLDFKCFPGEDVLLSDYLLH